MTGAGPKRLTSGGRIDRERPIEFAFNGRRLRGFHGDTLASALLANGVRTVARSFKFHRPRGVLSAGVEEPNALLRVTVGGTTLPITRATLQPLVAGLEARSENCYPSVDFDLGRIIDRTHLLWPAGFYNKTFKWPDWHLYEPLIRRAAGLGTLPSGADPARYFEHNLHCDVLVVGGGPAGVSAALAAARDGASVTLVEQDRELGGSMHNHDAGTVDGWIASAKEQLRESGARVLTRTLVAGFYDHNVLTALDHSAAERTEGRVERFWRIRAREVVLATGAIEQPFVFAHNDRPGIVLSGAACHYLHRYGVAVGANVLVATNNDCAWRTAFDLHAAGVAVAGIVDAREHPAERLRADAADRGLTVWTGAVVTSTRGDPGVRAAAVQALTPDGASVHGRARWIACDAVAMSAGWNPTVHLYSQAGGQVRYDERLGCIVPAQCRQRVRIVGAANGEFAVDAAIASGEEAGVEAARDARSHTEPGRYASPPRQVRVDRRGETFNLRALRRSPTADGARQWIDFQHDVTVADIELAVRENYTSIEHVKRYTTVGMSVDQGKTSNLNALTLLAELTGRSAAEVGTTTFRPQFLPVTMGAIGGSAHGEIYAPTRRLRLHERHEQLGAEFDDYGGWRRPALYVRAGETREQSIEREMLAARRALVLFDASPLGKIEICGPDAAEFVDRVYVNNMRSLLPGRVRYGLMLNENGIVIDDGICACLAADHFLVGTTSGGAERIAAWLEEWHQGEWPDLRLVMLPVTTQWAVVNIAGEQARSVLSLLQGDIDFSASAFPHLHVRTGQLEGDVARVQRVSFCGELSYEIAVPAQRATRLWTKLMTLGAAHGIEPIGLEAWVRLRIEKGFLHVGSDTDGTTNPLDLGFGPLVDRKPGDFIGRRSLHRPYDRRDDRRQLVGIEPMGESVVFAAGAHIVSGEGDSRRSEGFVTSACRSPILERSIGMALLERGAARLGQQVTIFDAGRTASARIVRPSFYDPDGARMNG